MVVSANHAKQADFGFLQDTLPTESCPEFNGYNTRLCIEQVHTIRPKTQVDYLPLDMTPSDPDTIMTSLQKAKVLSSQYGLNLIVFTGDLQLYRVAINIM
ncbi:hypothetical protein DPMN_182474 [Dreissena polymorpha]|uniref:Uncharacterized protein n=1 Tax=Dreissena polymorpha TaxID=45954 RepID=A0A9D4DEA0_DREPO|nr:hypothetical protein DPMN_182474 [Dreissena polymorpha]